MASEQITAKLPKTGKETAINYDFGDNLEDATAKFGEEVVFSNFKRCAVITAQAGMRRMMEAGKSQEEIQNTYDTWKPGVALVRTVDPVGALMAKFGKMSDEEKANLLQMLKDQM